MPVKATVGAASAGGSIGLAGALSHILLTLWWPNADPTIAVDVTTVIGVLLASSGTFLSVFYAKMEG